jgi:4-hydroxy-2-oxoheptanedioate aldolase
MLKRTVLSLVVAGAVAAGATEVSAQGGAETWEPRRINKAIELLEMGQPIYYVQVTAGGYDEGRNLAQTNADYITYNWEHYGVDFTQLREFMRGLVDGGPTRSGHRTPAVVVVPPAVGWNDVSMQANTWMMQNIINAGAHGILLPHAVDAAAVRTMIEAIRFPFAPPAPGLGLGRQGAGSQGYAAGIWGISAAEYNQKGDVWPLNPNGEIIIGLKVESLHGVAQAREMINVPGVTFAEWGPGDQAIFLGGHLGLGQPAPGDHPRLRELRSTVFSEVRAANKFFLNTCAMQGPENVVAMIDEGVMICTGGGGQVPEIGRRHTNRQMPW